MSTAAEVTLIIASLAVTGWAAITAWATIAIRRQGPGWTVAANNLAGRITDVANRLDATERRVEALEFPPAPGAPRLGVAPRTTARQVKR